MLLAAHRRLVPETEAMLAVTWRIDMFGRTPFPMGRRARPGRVRGHFGAGCPDDQAGHARARDVAVGRGAEEHGAGVDQGDGQARRVHVARGSYQSETSVIQRMGTDGLEAGALLGRRPRRNRRRRSTSWRSRSSSSRMPSSAYVLEKTDADDERAPGREALSPGCSGATPAGCRSSPSSRFARSADLQRRSSSRARASPEDGAVVHGQRLSPGAARQSARSEAAEAADRRDRRRAAPLALAGPDAAVLQGRAVHARRARRAARRRRRHDRSGLEPMFPPTIATRMLEHRQGD